MKRLTLGWIATCLLVPAMTMTAAFADPVDAKTMRTWKAKCVSCHGEDGKGQTDQGKKMGGLRDLSSAEVQKKLTDEKIKEILAKGVKEKKGDKTAEMDAYPDLAPSTVDGLIKIVRGLAK